MQYHEPPSSRYPPPSYPTSGYSNGSDSMLLGSMLGELRMGQSQIVSALGVQTGVLNQIKDRLEDNARLLAQKAPDGTTAATASLDERLRTAREILKTLVPLALLAAIILGKITFIEAWPMIRQSLGISG